MMRLSGLLLIGLVCFANAQDFRDEFNRSKRKQGEEFLQFQQKNDSIFAKFIIDSWQEMNMLDALEEVVDQKPMEIPLYQEKEEPIILKELPVDTIKRMRSFTPDTLESPGRFPELSSIEFEFYGTDLRIRHPMNLVKFPSQGSFPERLSRYWLSASKSAYQVILEDLFNYKKAYSLPDYAFFLMVDAFVDNLGLDDNEKIYFSWFLMNKASFITKIGLVNEKPIMLLAIEGEVYGYSYFMQDDIRFYALENPKGGLYTYGNPSIDNQIQLNLNVSEAIQLPLNPVSKSIEFEFGEEVHNHEFFFNRNVTDLLEDFPNSQLSNYLLSAASPLVEKSIQKTIGPKLEQLDTLDQIRYLLAFVQSLPYQTDQKQFVKERILYPDEFLAFPFSDCDDRVVYLSYLFRLFTSIEHCAVIFSNHVTLAIHHADLNYGEYIVHNGKKYVFCDPTYFNAPLGATIPSVDLKKATISPIVLNPVKNP